MDYYLGIDGGGSKTIFALADEKGRLITIWKGGSASYKQVGMDGVISLLQEGIRQVKAAVVEKEEARQVKAAAVGKEEARQAGRSALKMEEGSEPKAITLAGSVFGMPMYGESAENDRKLEELIKEHFPQERIKLVNDARVGWAGSLLMEPGINVVAGTGSIAYAMNDEGREARCGGWSEWFSDEGSGRWLGMKCMQLFSKEADGRLERGRLYELVREQLHLEQDEEIIDLFEEEYLPRRDRLASLQGLLLEAARAGDPVAIGAYEEAAEELVELARALKKRLFGDRSCPVACSGGIFQIGELILKPFGRGLKEGGMKLVERAAEPHLGAVLLAYYYAHGEEPDKNFAETLRKPV